MSRRLQLALASLLAVAGAARADRDDAAPEKRDAAASARDGDFLPQTVAARIGDRRVMGVVLGGYDTLTTRGATLSAVAEGAIANRIALRAGVDYVNGIGATSAQAGVRVGLLRQERHGVDLSLGALYRSVGFTEPRGVVEFSVLVGRRFNRLALVGNLVYGQGFTGDTRNAEVRAAILYALGDRLNLGLDTRARFDLGSIVPHGTAVGPEVDLDLLSGPTVSVALGPLALIAQAGAHVLVFEGGPTLGGFAAFGGVGASY